MSAINTPAESDSHRLTRRALLRSSAFAAGSAARGTSTCWSISRSGSSFGRPCSASSSRWASRTPCPSWSSRSSSSADSAERTPPARRSWRPCRLLRPSPRPSSEFGILPSPRNSGARGTGVRFGGSLTGGAGLLPSRKVGPPNVESTWACEAPRRTGRKETGGKGWPRIRIGGTDPDPRGRSTCRPA